MVQRVWSPWHPKTYVPGLWTDRPILMLIGGSGSAIDAHKQQRTGKTGESWKVFTFGVEKLILKVCVFFFFLFVYLFFLMQPEGAESDDPEGAPEKKPSGPSISVSRPSVSSGILIFVPAQRGDVNPATVSQLHSSHTSILIIHKLSK